MRQADLAHELQAKQMQLAQVETRLRQLEQEGQPSPYEVLVKPLPAQAIASMRQIVPDVCEVGAYCGLIYGRLYRRLSELNIVPLSPEITLYHAEEYHETDLDVEIGIAVAEALVEKPPGADDVAFRRLTAVDLAASLIYEGAYDTITDGVLALLKYVGTHGHVVAGPMRELHLSGPAHDQNSSNTTAVIELQVPIKPANTP